MVRVRKFLGHGIYSHYEPKPAAMNLPNDHKPAQTTVPARKVVVVRMCWLLPLLSLRLLP